MENATTCPIEHILSFIDLAELDIPDTIKLEFPDPSNILNFNVSIHPDEGLYKYFFGMF